MVKCPVYVVGGSGTGPKKRRVCNRDASALIEVRYSALTRWYANQTKFTDVFSMCSMHRHDFADITRWKETAGNPYIIHGVRGNVESISIVDTLTMKQLNDVVLAEKRGRIADSMKAAIIRLMGQSNASLLTIDDWKALCEEAVEEFTVETVMKS